MDDDNNIIEFIVADEVDFLKYSDHIVFYLDRFGRYYGL